MSAPDWGELSARLAAMAAEQSDYLETVPQTTETTDRRQRVEALESALERAHTIAVGLARPTVW